MVSRVRRPSAAAPPRSRERMSDHRRRSMPEDEEQAYLERSGGTGRRIQQSPPSQRSVPNGSPDRRVLQARTPDLSDPRMSSGPGPDGYSTPTTYGPVTTYGRSGATGGIERRIAAAKRGLYAKTGWSRLADNSNDDPRLAQR